VNLVADESLDREIVERLRRDGHAVKYVAEVALFSFGWPGCRESARQPWLLASSRRIKPG
jgi:hypothetical protein